MKLLSFILLGVLFSGATVKACTEEEASTASLTLASLLEPVGTLACNVPSNVNLASVMAQLTTTLNQLNKQQLKQLPQLVELTIGVKPAALRPFLSLSASEFRTLQPMLTRVSPDKLKAVLPQLARQPESTLDKMITFLEGIPQSQLEKLSPLFSRITQSQVDILIKAAQTMPDHAIEKLIGMVQAIGPITDVVVGAKQAFGLLPIYSSGSSSSSGTVSSGNAGGVSIGGQPGVAIRIGHRKLQQSNCDAVTRGAEISGTGTLMVDLGKVACKFGATELEPVMLKMLAILNRQSKQTLANLPEFANTLSRINPQQAEAFFQIPQATLKALIPMTQSLDPKAVTKQLKKLGSQSPATIEKMIFFMNNTPEDKVGILVPMFSRMSSDDVKTMSRLMAALSPGQIVLAINMMDKFGFSVNSMSASIPPAQTRGSTFMIGPIRVTVGGGAAAGAGSGTAGLTIGPKFVIG